MKDIYILYIPSVYEGLIGLIFIFNSGFQVFKFSEINKGIHLLKYSIEEEDGIPLLIILSSYSLSLFFLNSHPISKIMFLNKKYLILSHPISADWHSSNALQRNHNVYVHRNLLPSYDVHPG